MTVLPPRRAEGIEYRILGPLQANRGAETLELGPPKQRAVLAVLLLAGGRLVTDDRLISAVWGDDPPASVQVSLQSYISHLRRLLRGPDGATSPISRHSNGYVLDISDAIVDADEFARDATAADAAARRLDWAAAVRLAEAALAHWRGEPLDDLGSPPWVIGAAASLTEQRASCEETLISAAVGSRDYSRAVVLARPLCEGHPLREEAHRLAAIALFGCGRPTEALDVIRRYTRRLADQAGLDPGAALTDAERSILHNEMPRLQLIGPTSSSAPPTTPSPTSGGGEGSIPFVGRTTERAALSAALAPRPGSGVRWVVLTGPAGIGKSRLAEVAAADWTATGGDVAVVRCPEDAGIPAWWPIRTLLATLEPGSSQADITDPRGFDDGRFAVYERVTARLSDYSRRRPLLIVVDDVQWADHATLGLLTHLAESLRSPDIAFALTARAGTFTDEVARLLAAVARSGLGPHLEVGPLRTDEVRALAAAISGEHVTEREGAYLSVQTGGNPFFVTEYSRLSRDERDNGDVPTAVSVVLSRRLTTLDPATLQVLRTAAVMGDALDIGLLSAVTRLSREDLADHLDEAADEHFIVPSTSYGYAFGHGLIRRELIVGLPELRRRRLHAAIADAIGRTPDGDDIARRAGHLSDAAPLVDDEEIVDACSAAARHAESLAGSDDAAAWWSAALTASRRLRPTAAVIDRHDALFEARLAALGRAGRWQRVLDEVGTGLVERARAGRIDSAGRLAVTLIRTAGAWPWVSTDADPEALRARLAGVEPLCADRPAAHARILTVQAVGAYYEVDESVRDQLSARAVTIARGTGDPDVIADALLGRALSFAGVALMVGDVIALCDELLALAHRTSRHDDVIAHNLLSLSYLIEGDVDASRRHQQAGLAAAEALRLPVNRVQLTWVAAATAHLRGDLDTARRGYSTAIDLHRRTDMYVMGSDAHAAFTLAWSEGRLAEFDQVDQLMAPLRDLGRAAQAAARGDHALATSLIGQIVGARGPVVWATHAQLTLLAHLVADLALREHADALVSALTPYSGKVANLGQVGILGPVDLGLARVQALRGDQAAARELLTRAMTLSEKVGSDLFVERCRGVLEQV